MKKLLLTVGLLVGFTGAVHAEKNELPIPAKNSKVFIAVKNELPSQVFSDFSAAQESLYDRGVIVAEDVVKEIVQTALAGKDAEINGKKMYDLLCNQMFTIVSNSNDNVSSALRMLKKPENIKVVRDFLTNMKSETSEMTKQCELGKAELIKKGKWKP